MDWFGRTTQTTVRARHEILFQFCKYLVTDQTERNRCLIAYATGDTHPRGLKDVGKFPGAIA